MHPEEVSILLEQLGDIEKQSKAIESLKHIGLEAIPMLFMPLSSIKTAAFSDRRIRGNPGSGCRIEEPMTGSIFVPFTTAKSRSIPTTI